MHLTLDGNKIGGTLPSEIGLLSMLGENMYRYSPLAHALLDDLSCSQLRCVDRLEFAAFQNLRLVGSIPSELGNLSSVQYLYLQNNTLADKVQSEIGNLVNLGKCFFRR